MRNITARPMSELASAPAPSAVTTNEIAVPMSTSACRPRTMTTRSIARGVGTP